MAVITTGWDTHLWLWPEHCKMPVLCCFQPDRYKCHHLLVGHLGPSTLQLHLQKWNGRTELAGLQTERKRVVWIHQPQVSKALRVKSGCLTPASTLKGRAKSLSLVHSHCSLVTTNSSIPSSQQNMVVRHILPYGSLGATLSSSKRRTFIFEFWIDSLSDG